MLELLLPKHCAGCGAVGVTLCEPCRTAWRRIPFRVEPRVDPRVPVFALGPWGGVHRSTVLAIKERGRRDAIPEVGAVLRSAIVFLSARGELPECSGIVLSPAPTRKRAARLRGGDPVTAICRATGLTVVQLVHLDASVEDSAGLDAPARRANLVGAVRDERRRPRVDEGVVLVDDVVTTGATATATIERLSVAGIQVTGVVALTAA
ncbi:ComF family protein [Corynebacterium pygosceleis]|uniref:ComF family protein n=1 Tax=Corynebacterium pygosceleis TaxID=2800406 RepID=A0A9Q4C7P1_9CORY|nr:ComF family protein [Corynebacterium pygosceleis]MCK7637707.1 ComF family protein [Corynebacterium pygosceleis]MCK7674898.1 ComF family protein [Corynebacterium pygosceleis]MCL0119513.1 ComF family protein [Corynebacterium pygosceleis]MCX7467964.1 ComF family protein [Corynebacterium pygosceleis]